MFVLVLFAIHFMSHVRGHSTDDVRCTVTVGGTLIHQIKMATNSGQHRFLIFITEGFLHLSNKDVSLNNLKIAQTCSRA